MDLFDYPAADVAGAAKPLAGKLRTRQLDFFVGQQHWRAGEDYL